MQNLMRAPEAQTYRFGGFLLDVRHRVLIHGQESRPLPEKLFLILLVLLEADGRPVRKETFFERVWDGDVNEANLTQHVFMLRGLLGENARDHSHVMTVPGFGYRLASAVEQKAGLTMKQVCERCQRLLAADDDARICSYECTFCPNCAASMEATCPNCGGELVARPRRAIAKAVES